MGKDLSYEHPEHIFFITTRTMNSKLWFINNEKLEERVLAFLARYRERYEVDVFAFQLMGNHYHLIARFPKQNKAKFTKAFNAIVAKLVATHVKEFEGGKVWARPARAQVIGNSNDVLDRFFYACLNPIAAGLCKNMSDYPTYSSFNDCIRGRKRTFKILNREDYNNRRRYNRKLRPSECTTEHTLEYCRLPGHEMTPRGEYIRWMNAECQRRQAKIIEQRIEDGKGFASRATLLRLVPGSAPKNTKRSTRHSKRPLILTACMETKQRFLDWYFFLRAKYIAASRRFRAGDLGVEFPPGTYRPPTYCTV